MPQSPLSTTRYALTTPHSLQIVSESLDLLAFLSLTRLLVHFHITFRRMSVTDEGLQNDKLRRGEPRDAKVDEDEAIEITPSAEAANIRRCYTGRLESLHGRCRPLGHIRLDVLPLFHKHSTDRIRFAWPTMLLATDDDSVIIVSSESVVSYVSSRLVERPIINIQILRLYRSTL